MELTLPQALEILERTPAVVRELLANLSDTWLSANEGPETFSPRYVVGHLIHGEETDWIPRIQIILEHGEAQPFAPFDRVGFKEKYQAKSIGELIDLFATLRRENLERLRGFKLQAPQLELKGTHPAFGQVTLKQLLATWAVHDLTHIAQIVRVMAKQYDEAVGPWKAYLRILQG
ncbi:MAG: DinB family protein [Ignavibacteria bacterium]|nr:DinB family protein [Ignavibacteria bacterium]